VKKILITNRKGGVGKTTTTVNLAYFFAKNGYKTLIIDLDTQGHIQYALGVKANFEYGIHSFLNGEDIKIKHIIHKSNIKNLYFIPANINVNHTVKDKNLLKKGLERLNFDICLIDTAPSSDDLLESAIIASDHAIAPMKCEYLGLVGTLQFIKIFYKTASKLNTDFSLLGIIPTMYNKSIKEHQEIIEKLKNVIGKKRVFSPIRKDFKLTKIFSRGIKPVAKTHLRSLEDYNAVGNEILGKLNLKEKKKNY